MLVLGREIGEGVWIGEHYVRVVRVRGKKVRLAIQAADQQTVILREELAGRPVPIPCGPALDSDGEPTPAEQTLTRAG